jgi:hypothetical protein
MRRASTSDDESSNLSAASNLWGCGPTDKGARLRTLRSEFNSLHPLQIELGSRGLKHEDAFGPNEQIRFGFPALVLDGWVV